MSNAMGNKARMLFVMDVLMKHTDEEHRLSVPDIIEKLRHKVSVPTERVFMMI